MDRYDEDEFGLGERGAGSGEGVYWGDVDD